MKLYSQASFFLVGLNDTRPSRSSRAFVKKEEKKRKKNKKQKYARPTSACSYALPLNLGHEMRTFGLLRE
jgi:hypothetical protein